MKKHAPVVILILFVMLASALRHIILPEAKSAALRYGSAGRISQSAPQEEMGALREIDL